jgi:hypothetical protein
VEIARQWHSGKGFHFSRRVRILVRHFEIFRTLPAETRGGPRDSRSLLSEENVRKASLTWLEAQVSGGVTPKDFLHAINTTILPTLGIHTNRPLCERTARRWLIKLGWRRTTIRKGVYMDGHERPDVKTYRDKVFLPLMASYEKLMTRYEGKELTPVHPELAEGQQEIIALFHDESCFHANDFKSHAWLREGETILQKKSRGRLIHVSDFITEATGRLVLRDNEGNIVEDARKIIFPGSNGDPWWDTEQLLEQVADGLTIFEKAHPDCQALFIFDQSSAHASLGPDALKAFEMNKSDGGKQRKQKDTVIPESNPTASKRGKVQKMTNRRGEPKGLQTVLKERGWDTKKFKRAKCKPVCPFESQNCCMARVLSQQDDFVNQPSMLESLIKERGHLCIFLPKFHCELNPIEMYWGWCKYRYRQTSKKTFAEAKENALEYLDACPTDVIRRFIQRSWRFMSVYRLGLTGNIAAWAVRKQKSHRACNESILAEIDKVDFSRK